MRHLILLVIALCLSACGGGGVSALNAPNYQVGGTLSGLPDGAQVVISNGSEKLTLKSNGAFTFATPVATGTRYAVSVDSITPAAGLQCTVNNASSNAILGPVGNVGVSCAPAKYKLAATVQGLLKDSTLNLKLALTLPDKTVASQFLTLLGDGSLKQEISFSDITYGSTASIELVGQAPVGLTCTPPAQQTVNTNVSGLLVNCSGKLFKVYAKVTGLLASQQVVLLNTQTTGAVDTLAIDNSVTVPKNFPTPVQYLGDYKVTIDNTRTTSTALCTLDPSAQGTAITSDVTVNVFCQGKGGYTISVTTSNLKSSQLLTLLLNGDQGTNTLTVNGSSPTSGGAITSFFNPVAFGSTYVVSVGTQPTKQFCGVINGQGTISTNVSNVRVDCQDFVWSVSSLRALTQAGTQATFTSPTGIAAWTNPGGTSYIFLSEPSTNRVLRLSPQVNSAAGADPAVLDVYAGTGLPGANDGTTGLTSTFSRPSGLATDAAGNLYVADAGNHVIRKIAVNGGIVTTFAGSAGLPGVDNAQGPLARFNRPGAVAVDGAGNLFVADTGNHSIRKITPAGSVTTVAGSPTGIAGASDGVGPAAQFNSPAGLTVAAVDAAGNATVLFVADTDNSKIRRIDLATSAVSTFAGTPAGGYADGPGSYASFRQPLGIVFDQSTKRVYVADTSNNLIRQIDGSGVVTTIAGVLSPGSASDTYGWAARFNGPAGLLVRNGDLYALDRGNNQIRKLVVAIPPP